MEDLDWRVRERLVVEPGFEFRGFGFQVSDFRFQVSGFGFQVSSSRFTVQGSEKDLVGVDSKATLPAMRK